MNEFVVTSRQGVTCAFQSPDRLADGWMESFEIVLEADDFRTSACIANPGFDSSPSAFFNRLESHRAGWAGRESWRSAEGDLEIAATCDRTGHVTLSFTLPEGKQSRSWSATALVRREIGEMERLVAEARLFFERADRDDR